MRHICISDVHGDFDSMMKALNEVSYDPESGKDLIILAGDGFGRADFSSDLGGSRRVYEYMTSPIHKNKPIYIFGNHEDILRNILRKRMISYLDIQNGELNTILSLSNMANIGYLDPEMTEAIDKVRDCHQIIVTDDIPLGEVYYE
jgi:predicted phosphodiesterase